MNRFVGSYTKDSNVEVLIKRVDDSELEDKISTLYVACKLLDYEVNILDVPNTIMYIEVEPVSRARDKYCLIFEFTKINGPLKKVICSTFISKPMKVINHIIYTYNQGSITMECDYISNNVCKPVDYVLQILSKME